MIILREYQKEARDWLSNNHSTILADAPGVGKSYPTIEAAKSVEGTKLIVAPAYLIKNWAKYLNDCDVPATKVAPLSGTRLQKQVMLRDDNPNQPEWFIMSYQMLGQLAQPDPKNSPYEDARQKNWSLIVYDEAHRLRNRRTKAIVQAKTFARKGFRSWLLTGTPYYRNVGDIWTLLNLCDQKAFNSFWNWAHLYCVLDVNNFRTEVVRAKNADVFNRMVQPYMLRRTMQDVRLEVPDLLPTVDVFVDASYQTNKLYRKERRKALAQVREDNKSATLGSLIYNLRCLTATDENKLDAIKNLRSDLPGRLAVYCWYKSTASLLKKALKTEFLVTGDIEQNKRLKIINDFGEQDPTEQTTLVATIESMKEGVNLQHTQQIVFYEEDWISESNKQVIGRFHRYGQTLPVQVYTVRVCKTIDEHIANVHTTRRTDIAEALLEYLQEEL